ncbi:uncharacterized protein LOC110825008, partial [Carica papaya]|uniref:uncharacterized protein LOC110825008 n=1 Tax=Carica papaya TaxID=3649 RepID=UPI000B8CA8B3
SKDKKGSKVDEGNYRSLIGSLLYLTASRPDILFVVSLLSRYMASPRESHLQAAKHALRYLKRTWNFGVQFKVRAEGGLVGYSDSDWVGSMEDARSTTEYFFKIGSGAFSWASKKQDIVAQSTTDAEYVAAATTANQAIWLRKVFDDVKLDK